MKNKISYETIIIVICVIPLFVLFSFIDYENDLRRASTDSGFDSSWDYGGSSSFDSGGSSYGGSSSNTHSSSYNYEYDGKSGGSSGDSRGSSYTNSKDSQFLEVLLILAALGVLFYFTFLTSKTKNSKNTVAPDMTYKKYLVDGPGLDLSPLEAYGYTSDRLLDEAYKNYVEIQYAWSDLEIDKVKKLLSDEIYNMYKSELKVLRAKKQQNVMKDFSYVGGKITDLNVEKDALVVKVQMIVKCKDYLVNSVNKSVLRGNSSYINTYTYAMTFIIHSDDEIVECPNCSAKLGEGSSIKCEYCGTPITRKSKGLVLTRKSIIRQS